MTFFEEQEKARKKTYYLIFLFLTAVALIVIAVYLAVLFAFFLSAKPSTLAAIDHSRFFPPVAISVISIIALGSLYKILSLLRNGGEKIASHLGAVPVAKGSGNPKYDVLVNVVEEMSIASGVPVPKIYLLKDQESINAFAAGTNLHNAVVCVTAGTLNLLTRDELQGVIAHEFSHILNGDMRLNIRLIGYVYGILLLTILGRIILDSQYYSNSKKKDSTGLILFALLLILIGSIGTFFARLIKASISRQREFLADASAVQFTRNPNGIAYALAKIAVYEKGSIIKKAHAETVSHIFFAEGVKGFFAYLFSTHPPLLTRIKRVKPDFREKELQRLKIKVKQLKDENPILQGSQLQGVSPEDKTNKENFLKLMGVVLAGNIASANKFLTTLPPQVTNFLNTPYGAKAVLYTLVFEKEKDSKEKFLKALKTLEEKLIFESVTSLLPSIENLTFKDKLNLIRISLPYIQLLPFNQSLKFINVLNHLIMLDNWFSDFEILLVLDIISSISEAHPAIFIKKGEKLTTRASLHLLALLLSRNLNKKEESLKQILLSFDKNYPWNLKRIEITPQMLESASLVLRKASLKVRQRVITALSEALDCATSKEEKEKISLMLSAICTAIDLPG
ncbi:MAG: hypothetical protein D6780_01640 [Candidatus Dadabacteria bacterium]|nr:MAG: hypothetical protein D6780_01640 [Candidatus Dadabacteria bacterium]